MMTYQEKLKLFKSMFLLSDLPQRCLLTLAEFLKPRELPAGTVIFEEGTWGVSIYFISSGRVRIFKRTSTGDSKELAVVGPGDCFGEMALIDEVARSASAVSLDDCVLFELYRGDMARWARSLPDQAVQFFMELSQIQSKRLRKTSRELTMLFDISNLLANPGDEPRKFLESVLRRIVSQLEGNWTATAHVGNDAGLITPTTASPWLDDQTFHTALCNDGKTLGHLFIKAPSPVAPIDRDDLAQTLCSVCRPITTVLEKMYSRAERETN
jgi:CRP-like cAMP-binding protein